MTVARSGTLRRAGTVKSPKEGRWKDQDKVDGNQRASEVHSWQCKSYQYSNNLLGLWYLPRTSYHGH